MKTAFATAILLSGVITALAMLDDYAPFEPGDKPTPFPVHVWTNDVWHPGGDDAGTPYWCHVSESGSSFPRISLESHTNGQTFAVLELSPTQAVSRVQSAASGTCNKDVFVADLNDDKTDDYVLRTWSGGCGLAAEISYLTVFLSESNQYSGSCILGFNADPSDIVDLNGDGQPELIHTVFVHGSKGKDGKSHNYWVHNLLGFSGTNLVSRNDLDVRFPAWIWYTFKPNHKNTTQLTGDQKVKLWTECWHWHHYRDSFPNPDAFAEEQGKTTRK